MCLQGALRDVARALPWVQYDQLLSQFIRTMRVGGAGEHTGQVSHHFVYHTLADWIRCTCLAGYYSTTGLLLGTHLSHANVMQPSVAVLTSRHRLDGLPALMLMPMAG